MRKIEEQMCNAVHHNIDWKNGNTTVHFNEENGESVVRLHGNKIAVIGDDFLQIFDGGWQTTTTKSRLNALIDRFCNAVTDGVFQKDYQWYIRDNKVTRDFENGYIFVWLIAGHVSVASVSPSFPTFVNTFVFLIMTRSTALGMLRVGNTGEEILSILDVIVADIESDETINEIADLLFGWYHERMAANLFVLSAAIR